MLDAITGQNAISQAREFCKAADASGVILTKLDGTARAAAWWRSSSGWACRCGSSGWGRPSTTYCPLTRAGFVEELLPRKWRS